MLQQLRMLRPVRFHHDPPKCLLMSLNDQAVDYFFNLPLNKDISKHKLSDMEWTVLADLEVILLVRAPLHTWEFI